MKPLILEEQKKIKRNNGVNNMIIQEYCMYCGACAGVCVADAIDVQELKIVVDDEKCTKCGLCVKACPVAALSLE